MKYLPNRIFFTGVPGSKWSGIAQILETNSAFNISDRSDNRIYDHNQYSGHKGAYFGMGMEFYPDPMNVDHAWDIDIGIKLVKSHDWAYMLDVIKPGFVDDWIMLVYRPNEVSNTWWHKAGGFNITYPNYSHYINSDKMYSAIKEQNNNMLKFAHKHNATWNYFTTEWIKKMFKLNIKVDTIYDDILVSIIK
jgi:hypothetical protein